MKKLPSVLYKKIVDTMPVLCVDMVIKHQGKFLLVKRNSEPLKGEFWVPGGRVQKGETIEQTVRRKVAEEVGLKIKRMKVLGYFDKVFKKNIWGSRTGFHGVSIVFLVIPSSVKVILDEQSNDWKFSKTLPKLFNIKPFK